MSHHIRAAEVYIRNKHELVTVRPYLQSRDDVVSLRCRGAWCWRRGDGYLRGPQRRNDGRDVTMGRPKSCEMQRAFAEDGRDAVGVLHVRGTKY